MASCTLPAAFCLLFLVLACLRMPPQVDARRTSTHHLVRIKSLLPKKTCSSVTKDHLLGQSTDTELSLLHRDGPCSPLGRGKGHSHKQILDEDQARVDRLFSRMAYSASHRGKKQNASASEIPASAGTSIGTGNYIVTLGFGSPEKNQTLIFDTGSDVTWIQCQPCVNGCYQQLDQIFNPSLSATYSNISCSSNYCSHLDASSCDSGNCIYGVEYGDGSSTVGFFAKDTLTITPRDVIPDFRFGCGESNEGLFGQADGLLGLGRDEVSFVSQTCQKYGGVFGYCLPSPSSSTGYLTIGSSSLNVQFTPMLSDASQPSFYYLSLVGIIVDGKELPIQPTVFSAGGTIIDSGTVISRLPPKAYSALKSVFKKLMSCYDSAPALSILDTCYDFTGISHVKIPTVALQFSSGLTTNLDPSGILYVSKVSQACLAFAANKDDSDLGILGNVQQRKLDVVYDLSRKVIGFGSGGC